MKYKFAIPVYLISFIIETTIMPHMRIFDMTANLTLAVTVVFVYLYDSMAGIVLGTAFTFLRDIIAEPVVGIGAICTFAVAILVYIFRVYFNKENFIAMLLFSACSTFVYSLMYWVFVRIAGYSSGILYLLGKLPLMIILNTAVVTIIYLILIKRVTRYKRDDKYTGGYSPYRIMLKK